MAGLYWQDQELDFKFDIVSALGNPMGASGTNATHYNEDATYSAAFGSVTFDINEQWSIDYGLRWQKVKKDASLYEPDSFLMDANGNRISTFVLTPPAVLAGGFPFRTMNNPATPKRYPGIHLGVACCRAPPVFSRAWGVASDQMSDHPAQTARRRLPH